MLTVAITAAISAILALFGIKLSAGRLAVIAIVVKVIIVSAGLLLGLRIGKRRQAAQASQPEAPAPDPSRSP